MVASCWPKKQVFGSVTMQVAHACRRSFHCSRPKLRDNADGETVCGCGMAVYALLFWFVTEIIALLPYWEVNDVI